MPELSGNRINRHRQLRSVWRNSRISIETDGVRNKTGNPAAEKAPAAADRFYRPELDALRFFAFFAVLLHHGPDGGNFLSLVKAAGGFGLSIFFLLSGYLITELLLRECGQTDTIAWGLFFERRALLNLAAVLCGACSRGRNRRHTTAPLLGLSCGNCAYVCVCGQLGSTRLSVRRVGWPSVEHIQALACLSASWRLTFPINTSKSRF